MPGRFSPLASTNLSNSIMQPGLIAYFRDISTRARKARSHAASICAFAPCAFSSRSSSRQSSILGSQPKSGGLLSFRMFLDAVVKIELRPVLRPDRLPAVGKKHPQRFRHRARRLAADALAQGFLARALGEPRLQFRRPIVHRQLAARLSDPQPRRALLRFREPLAVGEAWSGARRRSRFSAIATRALEASSWGRRPTPSSRVRDRPSGRPR